MRQNFVVMLDGEEDLKTRLLTVGRRSSLQATADFESFFIATGVTPKKAVANSRGSRLRTYLITKTKLTRGEGGHSEKLCDFRQEM